MSKNLAHCGHEKLAQEQRSIPFISFDFPFISFPFLPIPSLVAGSEMEVAPGVQWKEGTTC